MSVPLSDTRLGEIRSGIVAELAAHHAITPNDDGTVICACGDRVKADRDRQAMREHIADKVLALLPAEPPQPSPEHQAIYLDEHDQVWCDYPTVPSGDDVLPLVWASEVAQSRRDLADGGNRLRVIGWCR